MIAGARRGPWPEPIIAERRRNPPGVWQHAHRQTRWPVVALSVLVLLLAIAVAMLAFYVDEFSNYVDGRSQLRDAEAERIEQTVRERFCDVLDLLPPEPRLDVARERNGCGPGSINPPY